MLSPSSLVPRGGTTPQAARMDAVRSMMIAAGFDARWNTAWPADQTGNPDAPLPERVLAVEKRAVVREPPAAIVVHEDHERLAGQAVGVDGVEDLAHAPIEMLNHQYIICACAGQTARRSARCGTSSGLPGGWNGQWGALNETSRKNGRLAFLSRNASDRSVMRSVRYPAP